VAADQTLNNPPSDESASAMSGGTLDARESKGFVSQPQAEVKQDFGDKQTTNTSGGDAAGGDLDKSTQVFNFFLFGGNSVGTGVSPLLQNLSQLLGQLKDLNPVRQAYRDALPADAGLSRPEAANYGDMVAQLQEFRRLPEFVQRLVQDEQIPQAIRVQLKDATQHLGPTEGWQQAVVVPPAATKILQSYLQIVLRPERSSNAFVINGWLIPDDDEFDPAKRFKSLDIDDQRKGFVCELEEIPRVMSKLVDLSIEKHLSDKQYTLTIETFFPIDYLCTSVDAWKLTEPVFEESYVVGRTYRVIVRSSERMERKYLHSEFRNRWCTNWERVKTSWHMAPCENDFEHLEHLVECNWERLEYGLMQKIGLKLTCGLAEAQKKQLFKCILKAATPIALWARCDVPECDQVTEISQLLLAGPLLKLSEKILQTRRDVVKEAKPEEHLGSHLALLWEDPYRLTPDALAQLVPPGK
jgi:uncharacterized protein (UPF0147 family)